MATATPEPWKSIYPAGKCLAVKADGKKCCNNRKKDPRTGNCFGYCGTHLKTKITEKIIEGDFLSQVEEMRQSLENLKVQYKNDNTALTSPGAVIVQDSVKSGDSSSDEADEKDKGERNPGSVSQTWCCKIKDQGDVPFDSTINAVLEEARLDGRATIRFKRGKWIYEVDIKNHIQTNVDTGRTRPLCCHNATKAPELEKFNHFQLPTAWNAEKVPSDSSIHDSLQSMSVKDLKDIVSKAHLGWADCLDKAALRKRATEAMRINFIQDTWKQRIKRIDNYLVIQQFSELLNNTSRLGIGNDQFDIHPKGYNDMRLVTVYRNENPRLYQVYTAKRALIKERMEKLATPDWTQFSIMTDSMARINALLPPGEQLDSKIGEQFLLHCTNPVHILSILKSGLNPRYAGNNAGVLMGKGNYFADTAAKADQYAAWVRKPVYHGKYTSIPGPRRPRGLTYERSKLRPLDELLYDDDYPHPENIFYMLVFQTILGDVVPTRDCKVSVDGSPIFHDDSKRELAMNPKTGFPFNTLVGQPCPHPLHSSGRCPHGCLLRRREFMQTDASLSYPAFLLVYRRVRS